MKLQESIGSTDIGRTEENRYDEQISFPQPECENTQQRMKLHELIPQVDIEKIIADHRQAEPERLRGEIDALKIEKSELMKRYIKVLESSQGEVIRSNKRKDYVGNPVSSDKNQKQKENGLIIASSDIYCLDENKKKLWRTHIGNIKINALAVHNGRLYFGRGKDITVIDGQNIHFLERRKDFIKTLISHGGKLYDAGEYGIFDTFNNKKISKMGINNLVSHNGRLYGCGHYYTLFNRLFNGSPAGIFDILNNPPRIDDSDIASMVSHRSRLYYNKWDGSIGDLFNYGECVSPRRNNSCRLVSHNDKLYHLREIGGYTKMYDTLGDPEETEPILTIRFPVECVQSIDKNLWERLVKYSEPCEPIFVETPSKRHNFFSLKMH